MSSSRHRHQRARRPTPASRRQRSTRAGSSWSSGEAIPTSTSSTPTRTRWRAMATFCSRVKATPTVWLPSRRVLSTNPRTCSMAVTSYPCCRHKTLCSKILFLPLRPPTDLCPPAVSPLARQTVFLLLTSSTLPLAKTTRVSPKTSTSAGSWVMTTRGTANRCRISSSSMRIRWRSMESRAENGSSSRRMEGFLIMALARATRCFWPPDNSAG